MNRQFVLITIVIAGAFAGATAFAQERPHDEIMKEIGATFASLRRNLDANSAAAAVEDAAKLEGLFRETEAWWAPLKTKDALRYAKFAGDAAAAVGAAAKSDDIAKAKASSAAIQKSCAACHFTHREDTGKGYLIKP